MADRSTARRSADKAAEHLDEADSPSSTHEGRKLDALRGIGWAILALDDRLAAVLDAADDRNTQLEGIADAVGLLHREPRLSLRQWLSGLAWRWWGARRAERAWRGEHAGQPPLGTAVLAGEEITLVQQALKDAEGHSGDERLAAACADLLAGLTGGDDQ